MSSMRRSLSYNEIDSESVDKDFPIYYNPISTVVDDDQIVITESLFEPNRSDIENLFQYRETMDKINVNNTYLSRKKTPDLDQFDKSISIEDWLTKYELYAVINDFTNRLIDSGNEFNFFCF